MIIVTTGYFINSKEGNLDLTEKCIDDKENILEKPGLEETIPEMKTLTT